MAAMGELLMKRLIQVGATVAIGAGVASKALYNGNTALAVASENCLLFVVSFLLV